jgi:ribosomal subunit interface protein
MLIQVNYASVIRTDAIDEYVNERIGKELAHFSERLTRVEVHLHDDNGASKNAANDKRVTIEARPRGQKPLAVEHAGDNLQAAIAEAASKLQRALRRSFERLG